MESVSRPFELTMRLRNNLLRARRQELGLSCREMAEKIGVSASIYSAYETLNPHAPPVTKKGWGVAAVRIAHFFGVAPEELWPEVILDVACPVISRELTAEQVRPLLGSQMSGITHALPPPSPEETLEVSELSEAMENADLTPREREILMNHYGLGGKEQMTLREIGDLIAHEFPEDLHPGGEGFSVEHIRQVEARAISKIRRWFETRTTGDISTDLPDLGEWPMEGGERESILRSRMRTTNDPNFRFSFTWSDFEKRKLLESLYVWFCDTDVVIARSVKQANKLVKAKFRKPSGEWKMMPYDRKLSCMRNGRLVTRTCAQWIISRGTGWFFAREKK